MPRRQAITDPLVLALLGEAAGEGEEGMRLVLDSIVNRSRARGKTLEQIVMEPHQFLAMSRPDLQQFVNRQPPDALETALFLAQQGRLPDYTPTYPTQYYVTQDLFDRRKQLPATHWIQSMEPYATVGRHVALTQRRGK